MINIQENEKPALGNLAKHCYIKGNTCIKSALLASFTGSRGAKRTKTLKKPNQHGAKPAKSGASGNNTSENNVRIVAINGNRSENRAATTGSTPPQEKNDSGRSERERQTPLPLRINADQPAMAEQRKRARRRKRGKSAAQKNTHLSENAVNQPSLSEQKVTDVNKTKLTKRKRRSRRKKSATQTSALQAGQPQNSAQLQASSMNENGSSAAHRTGDVSRSPRSIQRSSHAAKAHTAKTAQSKSMPQPQAARSNYLRNNSYEAPLYAALDLGTNNCRLLVASPTRPGQFRVVDAFSRIVRLGEGLSTTGRLNEQAMDRAVEALKICRDKLTVRNVKRSRLIATEACRAAENGDIFLQRVRNEVELELEIVDRQTEARLAVSGCGTLVARETDAIVLFDIGGGSSEIALIDVSKRRSPRLAEHIIAWTSLPVGVVTLAERFGGRDVTPESFSAMVGHVSELLSNFQERHHLGQLAQSTRFHLLGTSGTVTTLAGIHLGLERYDRRRVDGMWMGADEVTHMTDTLLSWGFDKRVANPCIGADRADLVLAGCAILDAIRNVWPSEKLLVADRGLREGILTELMSRDGAWRHFKPNGHKNRQYS